MYGSPLLFLSSDLAAINPFRDPSGPQDWLRLAGSFADNTDQTNRDPGIFKYKEMAKINANIEYAAT